MPMMCDITKANQPKALSAFYDEDGGTIYAASILNKVVGRAYDVPGAGEQGVLYLPLDNAMWNDEELPFYHHGRYMYHSVPSRNAVQQGRQVVVGVLSSEAAKQEVSVVLFMGADNAAFNKELGRLGCIPGVPGSHVKDVTQDLTDSPRPFGLKDGSALEVHLPGATQPQLWLSMVHAGAYAIYLERLSTDTLYLEVPLGIDSAMRALRKFSGRSEEGAVPWGMVQGGGKGMTDEDKAEMERLDLDPRDVEDVAWYCRHKGGSASVQAKEEAGVSCFMATGSSISNPATPEAQHKFHVDCGGLGGSASVQAKEEAGVSCFMATGSSISNPATPEAQHKFHVDCANTIQPDGRRACEHGGHPITDHSAKGALNRQKVALSRERKKAGIKVPHGGARPGSGRPKKR